MQDKDTQLLQSQINRPTVSAVTVLAQSVTPLRDARSRLPYPVILAIRWLQVKKENGQEMEEKM